MLSKMKVVGMTDERWTTRDKITQYKGLIKFFAREQKQHLFENAAVKRKQVNQIRELRKDIDSLRAELYDTLSGDQQRLRNNLQHHREAMLAYGDLLPPKVVEHVQQNSITKRKELDRLKYKKKQCMEKLKSLQLQSAELQNSIGIKNTSASRYSEQVLEKQIQNVGLRFNTSKNINRAYRTVIDLLKQDSLYFDAVLHVLRHDAIVQSGCMIHATRMGQEATEYLATLQDEFKTLEKQIKENMKERSRAVTALRKDVKQLFSGCMGLVRVESDTEMQVPQRSPSELQLSAELEELQEILADVQSITAVSTFDDIFPRIKEQLHHKTRLLKQLTSNTRLRDNCLNNRNHVQLIVSRLESSMVDTTFSYKEEKKRLLSEIASKEESSLKMKTEIEERGDLLMMLRCALQTIYEMVSGICEPSEFTEIESHQAQLTESRNTRTLPPPKPKLMMSEDAEEILDQLYRKLEILIKSTPQVDRATVEKATGVFQRNVIELLSKDEFSEAEQYEVPLVDIQETEDSSIMTRQDVKNNSALIVRQFENPGEYESQMAIPTFSKGGRGHLK